MWGGHSCPPLLTLCWWLLILRLIWRGRLARVFATPPPLTFPLCASPTTIATANLSIHLWRNSQMMKSAFLAAALLAATLAVPARAQDMKKDQPVKPADSPSKVLLDSWNDIGRKLTAMAEDFPEDKYDFKPTPVQRSFSEQLVHAAGA